MHDPSQPGSPNFIFLRNNDDICHNRTYGKCLGSQYGLKTRW